MESCYVILRRVKLHTNHCPLPQTVLYFLRKKYDDPTISRRVPKNVTVRRVSLDVRNPKNSPDTIDTKVLNEYAKAIADKTFNPKDIKVVQDGNTTRVYKPMVVGKVCLKCHGSNVSKEVKEVIAKKYPADKAINLKEGTLRGAFVAEIK